MQSKRTDEDDPKQVRGRHSKGDRRDELPGVLQLTLLRIALGDM
jgi:hypothetical protein